MQIICYEIGDLCYYVTASQDRVLQKFTGEKKDKFIKKTSFANGKLGEPITNSEGALAIVWPIGKEPEGVLIDPNAPPGNEPEEPTADEPTSEAKESGVHL